MAASMRIFWTLVMALVPWAAGAQTGEAALPLVNRAIEAMGGAGSLGSVRTLVLRGQHRHWEPQQSQVPNGEPRFGGESDVVVSRDLTSGATRMDWDRRLLAPGKRVNKYSEVLAGGVGYVYGIDSTSRTTQSVKTDPPQHAMSLSRYLATQREVERISPRLLLAMRAAPVRLTLLADQPAGDQRLPAVRYDAPSGPFIVLFDPATGLPERVRTLDSDAILGDAAYDAVFSDWRSTGSVKLAYEITYLLAGQRTSHLKLVDATVNPQLGAALFDIPEAARLALKPETPRSVPYQWMIRRAHWGTLMDSDRLAFDGMARPSLELKDIAPGVSHMVGGSHNSLVVEMRDHLVVFDAPIGEVQSEMTIAAAKQRYPGKPIRYLVLTHHHMDHANGTRTFGAEGAAIVVGQGAGAYIRAMMVATNSVAPDRLARNPRLVEVIEVADKRVLNDGTRAVELHRIANTHAEGMLIGYIPHAKLGFVTDLWSPGRDPIGPNVGQTELVRAVVKAGIDVEQFAGGHGSTAPYKPLADAVLGKEKVGVAPSPAVAATR
jgi:glyoxylase-like metal-dependent hydrolase (beta-lactamase superfamily II)